MVVWLPDILHNGVMGHDFAIMGTCFTCLRSGTCMVCNKPMPLDHLLLDEVSLLEVWGGVTHQRCFCCVEDSEFTHGDAFLDAARIRRALHGKAAESLTSYRDQLCYKACGIVKDLFPRMHPKQIRALKIQRREAAAMTLAAALFPESMECCMMADRFRQVYLEAIAEAARSQWNQGDGKQTFNETAYLNDVGKADNLFMFTCIFQGRRNNGTYGCNCSFTHADWIKAKWHCRNCNHLNSPTVSPMRLTLKDPFFGFTFLLPASGRSVSITLSG